MPFFVCVVPVCPIRAEPSHKSEQVSQLLFGELCQAQELSKDFIKIKAIYDGYEGWCQRTQLSEFGETLEASQPGKLAGGWINTINVNDQPMRVPFGSRLSTFSNGVGNGGKLKVEYDGEVIVPSEMKFSAESIKKFSNVFLNTPYQWGGRTVFGVDCSGLTQLVFSLMGVKLQRDAYQQATQGEAIGFLQEGQCGDLAFFDNESGRITHVGILLDSETIIHASGKVRIDTIDNAGIVNRDTNKRTHNLRVIKRIFL